MFGVAYTGGMIQELAALSYDAYRSSRKSAADDENGVTRTMLSQPAALMALAMLLKSESDS